MLGWLFKKKDKAPSATAAATKAPAPAAAKKGPAAPPVPAAPSVDWAALLAQASGNDEALLALASQAGAPLQVKQSAVEALTGEPALKAAELAFRSHDRRVHQLAKRRLAAAVAQRQARAQAASLINTARGMAGDASMPVSRGVELDQAWQALDTSLLAPEQVEAFAALSAQLTAQVRQRTDRDQQRKRWAADAGLALQQVQAVCTEAAAGRVARTELAAALAAGQGVLAALPPESAVEKTDQAASAAAARLQQALDTAAALDHHLAVLDRLLATPPTPPTPPTTPPTPPTPADAAESDDSAAPAPLASDTPPAHTTPADHPPADDPQQAWQALPPLADAPLAALLSARVAGWQLAREQHQLSQQAQRRAPSLERQPTRQSQQATALAETLVLAEAALDAGHLADAQRYQAHIDKALQGGEPPEALRARVAAAQGRLSELRGWQHWAGARARDELVQQAEALAAATLGAAVRTAAAGGAADGVAEGVAEGVPEGTAGGIADGIAGGIAGDVTGGIADAAAEGSASAGHGASSDGIAAVDGRAVGEGSAVADGSAPAPDHPGPHATPAADEAAPSAGAAALAAEVARLSVRQRVDVIDTLRARWKEMDRQGGGGGQALWPRFDAAMKAAYAPVAAHMAAQRAVREANLQARQRLLDALEAASPAPAAPRDTAPELRSEAKPDTASEVTPNTAPDTAPNTAAEPTPANAAEAEPAVPQPAPAIDQRGTDHRGTDHRAPARALASALDRFQAEWRKLGPLEHTVPREARTPLGKRLAAAVQRAEATVQAARGQARSERLALVARAQALADDGAGRGRDLVADARALQAEWQQHAKGMPLSRGDEQALWTEFKTAVDAAFAAREAGYSARDAEFEANAAERQALIDRLRLQPDDSAATQRRSLAEVDAAWRRCGPAPRARAAALDADYQAARAALQQWLDQSAQRAWQATADALDAKLALCAAREARAQSASASAGSSTSTSEGEGEGEGEGESGGGGVAQGSAETDAAAWQALPVLPAPLEAALRQRAGLSPAAAPAASQPAPAINALLLQLEADWQLPTPPAFEAARRAHKLMAMKAALEGRRANLPEHWAPDAALAHLLGRTDLDEAQQARLATALAAWRRRGPPQPA